MRSNRSPALSPFVVAVAVVFSPAAAAAAVTYAPYIQPGDAGRFGPHDQIVIAWQTDESVASSAYRVEFASEHGGGVVRATGRVVDAYLAADPGLPVPPTATGPRVDYYAVLPDLQYDTTYRYAVFGPGLP